MSTDLDEEQELLEAECRCMAPTPGEPCGCPCHPWHWTHQEEPSGDLALMHEEYRLQRESARLALKGRMAERNKTQRLLDDAYPNGIAIVHDEG